MISALPPQVHHHRCHHGYLDEVFGVALLPHTQIQPQPITIHKSHGRHHDHLEEIFGVALLQQHQSHPEPVTIRKDRDRDYDHLEERFGVTLLQHNQTCPTPITVSQKSLLAPKRRNCVWFDTLPLEVREIILEFVYADDSLNIRLEQRSLKVLPVRTISLGKNALSTGAMISMQTPSLPLQLFVSKHFLAEAVEVYARISLGLLRRMWLGVPREQDLLIGKVRSDVCKRLKHLIIADFDIAALWMPTIAEKSRIDEFTTNFPNSMIIDIFHHEDCSWKGDCDGLAGEIRRVSAGWPFCPWDWRTHSLSLNAKQLQEISTQLRVPREVENAMLDPYSMSRFSIAKEFAQNLKRHGWRGKVHYHLRLHHMMRTLHPESHDKVVRDTKLIMKFDILSGGILKLSTEYGEMYTSRTLSPLTPYMILLDVYQPFLYQDP